MKWLVLLLVLVVSCMAQSAPDPPGNVSFAVGDDKTNFLTNGILEQSNNYLTTVPITLPPFGNLVKVTQTFIVPVFNRRVYRCTDINTGGTAATPKTGSYDLTGSGGMNERQFNHNHTRLLVLPTNTGSAILLGFSDDKKNMQCTNALFNWKSSGTLWWDWTDSDVLYELKGTVVTKWQFAPDDSSPPTSSQYFDYSASCPGMPSTANNNLTWTGAFQESSDGSFVTAFSYLSDGNGKGQDTGEWVAAYSPSKNACQLINTMTGVVTGTLGQSGTIQGTWFPHTLHSVTVSKSGMIDFGIGKICNGCPKPHGPFLLKVGTLQMQMVTKSVGGHSSPGVNKYVNLVNSPATVFHGYDDVNNDIQTFTIAKNTKFSSGQTHLAWPSSDDTQPVFFSYMQQPCPAVTQPLMCEIFAASPKTGNYGNFYRIGPSWSSGLFNGFNFRAVNAICSASDDAAYIACSTDALNTLGNSDGKTGTCQPGGIMWTPSTSFTFGQVAYDDAKNPNGHVFTVITPGLSGASSPSWNSSGGTTTDNTVVWQDLGQANCRNDVIIYETGLAQ